MSHLVSCSVPNGPYLSRPSLIILCMSTSIPSRLSDTALLAEVLRLARSARATTVSLVAHLAELDARRLYLGAGFSSLFTYCTAVLGLSESETYNRIEAARAARRFPVILDRLADGRYEIRFTARAETREKLRRAQDLLRHAIPSGDPAEIFDRALTALLEDLVRKKCAATGRPRSSRGTAPGSRHIPAKVKRAVWLRDGSRCAFVARSGRRCAERGFLELHHVEPHAVGGEATIDNVHLRCRAHNAYEAELFYGPAKLVRGDGVVREPSAVFSYVAEPRTRSRTS